MCVCILQDRKLICIWNLFLQVEMPESAELFKEGYILKKNIMEAPHKKGDNVFDQRHVF